MHSLIVLAGLPGTGKTTAAKYLTQVLNYKYIDQNSIRRQFGFKKMPKTQDKILRTIDQQILKYLTLKEGVVVDSVHRFSFRRQQLYGIASSCDANVIIIEVICPQVLAKERIRKRPKSDGLLSDPNQIRVYDKLKNLWEEIDIDFKYPGNSHVSYIQFDSSLPKVNRKLITSGMNKLINGIEKTLLNINRC
ncbi:ATP-binding protein [Candidatus Daviesbacteria bacterium]|nr:ATP-binding protein [Candidatus Daviesbacteria bacterium]